MEEVTIFFLRHGNALEHENQRTARGADIDGLVRCIQYKHRRKQGMSVTRPVHSRRRREQAGRVPGTRVMIRPE
jgi:hypothetical protein